MSGSARETPRTSGNGREASRMSEIGGDALPDVSEWSGGPPGCPEVVGRYSRKSGSGREDLQGVREWCRGHP